MSYSNIGCYGRAHKNASITNMDEKVILQFESYLQA